MDSNFHISTLEQEKRKLIKSFRFPFYFVLLLWAIKIFEIIAHVRFVKFGIFPRTQDGLLGIITSPLIHADFNHLINNSIPLIILGASLFYFYKEIAYKVFFLIWLVGDFWLWAIGRPSFHIGASGIVYGLVAFLFLSGILRKNIRLMAVSIFIVFLYGGLVWGILPIDYHISFEGHLTGSIIGLVLAWHYKKQGPQRQKYSWELEEPEEELHEAVIIHPEDSDEKPKNDLIITYHYKASDENHGTNS